MNVGWILRIQNLALVLFLLLVAPGASARCDDARAEAELVACRLGALQSTDGRINEVYRQRMGDLDAAGKVKLRTEQRAWLRQRNASCALETKEIDLNKWFQAIARDPQKTECLLRMTEERISHLGTVQSSRKEEQSSNVPCVNNDRGRITICEFGIHPSLPPYVFRLVSRPIEGNEDGVDVQIEVSRKGRTKVLQVLKAEDVYPQGLTDRYLQGVDANFDGYLDIRLLMSHGRKQTNYRYWLFNPRTGLFKHYPKLEELCDIGINPGDEKIGSYCYLGGAGQDFFQQTLRWKGGRLLPVEELAQDGESWYYAKLRNGRLQVVVKDTGGVFMRNLGGTAGVTFVTPQVGWVVGVGGRNGGDDLLQTADGGQTWTVQRSPISRGVGNRVPLQMQFLDAWHGWVLYYGSRLHRTTDGGRTWRAVQVKPEGQRETAGTELGRFVMVTPQIGFGVDEYGGQFLHTTDGGQKWRARPAPKEGESFRHLFFLDVNRGWIAGDEGNIYTTMDGGETWDLLPRASKDFPSYPGKIQFISPEVGWILGGNPRDLFRTDNGGRSWRACEAKASSSIAEGFFFRDMTHGWVLGKKGVILGTIDGCATWKAIYAPAKATLQDVHFVDYTHGWAVGGNDTLLKTTDGGQTWARIPVKVP